MAKKKILAQQIAVFGESGSGKTVLLSSFYGAMKAAENNTDKLFRVLARDSAQGVSLYQNYLGMKNSNRAPDTTRFESVTYSFDVKLKGTANTPSKKPKHFDALQLDWHDYPGQWFEQDPSGAVETKRRVDTFKSLLGSDVALLLVDAQRLLDNAGGEERYLKSLLSTFSTGLIKLKDDLLTNGEPLVRFPRIWVIALSKADLLPDLNVEKFRDLVIEKAGGDLNGLRTVLSEFIVGKTALSVGEDFVRISSARFADEKIEVSKRIGVDLVLPMASMLPLERHIGWAKDAHNRGKLAEYLLHRSGGAVAVALALLMKKVNLPGPAGAILSVITTLLPENLLDDATSFIEKQQKEKNREALAAHDYLAATLSGFQMDLEQGEKDLILITSAK